MPNLARRRDAARRQWPSIAGALDQEAVRELALVNAGVGLWQLAVDFDELICDLTAAQLLSSDARSPPDTRASLLAQIHPGDRDDVALRLELCGRVGTSVKCSFRLAPELDAERWLELTGTRAARENGKCSVVGTLRDITKDRQLADALEQSERRLATTLGQTMVGVFHSDRNNNILMVNDRYLELMGRTREELSGLTLANYTHPEDLAWNIPLFSKMSEAGKPFTIEKRYVRPDGTTIWCEVNVSFVPGPDGKWASSIAFAHDITDRKLAEAEQRRAREMLALALDGAGAGIWELDLARDGKLQLSPNAMSIYGLPQDHGGSLGYDEWAALLDPASLSKMNTEFGAFVNSEEPHTAEFKIRRPDGEERWLRIHGRAVMDEGGQAQKIVGLVYDDSDRKLAEEELRASEQRLHLSQEAARIGTFVTTAGGETVGSAQFFRNLGLPEDTQSLDDDARRRLLHPDDEDRAMREIAEAVRSGTDFHETEYRIVRADNGETRWVLARIKPECDADGRLVRMVGAHLDITEAKTAALRLQETVRLNEGIVDSSPDCIKILGLDGTLRFISQRGLQTMEAGNAESLLGTRWQDLWPENVRPVVENAILSARAGESARFDAGCITLRGNPMWLDVVVTPLKNHAGEVTELLGITRDVTELRQHADRIRWTAEHDALTGLPNRNYFDDRLEAVLTDARASAEKIGLLALDVDNFKQVNDAFGHDAGDALLKELSQRVQGLLGEEDFGARLGGDEFAIVLRHLETGRDVLKIGNAVNAAMRQPAVHQGRILDCRVSIGVAIFPVHGEARDELLKSADTALYAAKIGGRNSVLLFEPAQRAELDRRTAMIGMAKSALNLDNIVPFYQPKVFLRTGEIVGFEALLRWRDSNGSIRSPAEVEAAFEDLELAHEISERMQDRILEDLKAWLDRDLSVGHIAINAAAAEFSRNDFAPRLLDKLSAAGVAARHLQVEVTETVFLGRGAEHVREALSALKASGVDIALDDFGTGYASLSHLKNFPVDVIKVDRSFITDIGKSAEDTAIVRALLGLAADLQMLVVAEGIETEAQAAFLRERNCGFGQGYLFGKPVGSDRVPALIETPGVAMVH